MAQRHLKRGPHLCRTGVLLFPVSPEAETIHDAETTFSGDSGKFSLFRGLLL